MHSEDHQHRKGFIIYEPGIFLQESSRAPSVFCRSETLMDDKLLVQLDRFAGHGAAMSLAEDKLCIRWKAIPHVAAGLTQRA